MTDLEQNADPIQPALGKAWGIRLRSGQLC